MNSVAAAARRRRPRARRAGRPARRSSAAARSWSAPRCRRACRPSGRPRRSALATPCTASSVLASSGGVDRGEREPEAEAAEHQRRRSATACVEAGQAPAASSSTKPTAASTIPAAVTTPARQRCGSGSRRARAPTGSATRKPHQHQRGDQLGVGVDRGPGEDRDVDQRGDQRRADEEADQQRAPGRAYARSAPRGHQRGRRRGAGAARTRPRRAPPTEQVPAAPVGEDLRPRGRRWRRPGSRRPARAASSSAPTQVGLARATAPQPRRSTSGRRAVRQRTTKQQRQRRIAASPTGVSQRPSPANGTKSGPHGEVAQSAAGGWTQRPARRATRVSASSSAARARSRRAGAGRRSGAARRPARAAIAAARTRPTARLIEKMRASRRPRAPRRRTAGRARCRAPGPPPTTPSGHAAALGGVEVGDQRERRGHQAAAADALEEPAGDHAGQVVGQRGDQRAEREDAPAAATSTGTRPRRSAIRPISGSIAT